MAVTAFNPLKLASSPRDSFPSISSSTSYSVSLISFVRIRNSVGSPLKKCLKQTCSVRAMSSSSFESGMEESVKKTVNDNTVVVYSKTWCPYVPLLIKFLLNYAVLEILMLLLLVDNMCGVGCVY